MLFFSDGDLNKSQMLVICCFFANSTHLLTKVQEIEIEDVFLRQNSMYANFLKQDYINTYHLSSYCFPGNINNHADMEIPKMFYTDLKFASKALVSHAFKKLTNIQSIEDCLMLCLAEPECHSFNIKLNKGMNKGICEINNSTAVDHAMDLVDKPGYTYYQET